MGPEQLDRPADLHAKGSQVFLLQQTHGIAVHARDLLPALDHLVWPQLIHVPAFAISGKTDAGSQRIYIGLKLRWVDQLFLASIEKIAQIFKKLTNVGWFDEALQAQLPDSLAEEDVDILRRKDKKVLLLALENADDISLKTHYPDPRTPRQPALKAAFESGSGVLGESERPDFFRPSGC